MLNIDFLLKHVFVRQNDMILTICLKNAYFKFKTPLN